MSRTLECKVLGQYLVNQFREGLRNGIDRWLDDDLKLMRPWGLELSEVEVPMHPLYQGIEYKMVCEPLRKAQGLQGSFPRLMEGPGEGT